MIWPVLLCVIGFTYGSPMAPVEYDVIVVGLGISGTAAAATLAGAGKKVLALEAQDRIGGRVYTHEFGGALVELGAEWIHGTEDSPSYELAVQNNVSLKSDDIELQAYQSNATLGSDVVTEVITYAMELTDDPPPVPEPLGQYITRRTKSYLQTKYPYLLEDADFMDNFLNLLEQLMNNYEASNSWNDVSTNSQYNTLRGDQHVSWHRHGYRTLFNILLNTYNNGPGLPNLTTKLNTEVVNIKWPKDTTGLVEVTTKDGSVYKADAVIVTVSIGVLKGTHGSLFTPPLPADKSEAIRVISMGVMDKVDLLFRESWWSPQPHFYGFLWRNHEKNQLPKGDEWLTKVWGASAPAGHDRVLTLWTSGETAKLVETLPAEEVKSKLTGVLRLFFGTQVPDPVDMVRSTWFSNPYTRGSYSFDSILGAQHPGARAVLAAPLVDVHQRARVLFAGEATHRDRFSTVHGALATGRREADRLLQTHSKL